MLTITLYVTLIMPPKQDDITQTRVMSSIEECWSTAKAWVEQDARLAGGVGLAAACASTDAPGAKS